NTISQNGGATRTAAINTQVESGHWLIGGHAWVLTIGVAGNIRNRDRQIEHAAIVERYVLNLPCRDRLAGRSGLSINKDGFRRDRHGLLERTRFQRDVHCRNDGRVYFHAIDEGLLKASHFDSNTVGYRVELIN